MCAVVKKLANFFFEKKMLIIVLEAISAIFPNLHLFLEFQGTVKNPNQYSSKSLKVQSVNAWETEQSSDIVHYKHTRRTGTMCDFLDFGLTFFSIMCILVVARLPQRLKSTFFERPKLTFLKFFLHFACPFGAAPFEKISKNVNFSLSKNVDFSL